MADKSAFIPVDLSGASNMGGGGAKKGDLDLDDDAYFGGIKEPAPPKPVPVSPTPPSVQAPSPPVVQSTPAPAAKKPFVYSKPNTYHKAYAGGKN